MVTNRVCLPPIGLLPRSDRSSVRRRPSDGSAVLGEYSHHLTRFFRDQGADWCRGGGGDRRIRRITLISGSHRTAPTRRSPHPGPVPRGSLVHPRTHPGATGTPPPRPRPDTPRLRARPVPSMLHPPTPGRPPHRSPPSPPGATVRGSSIAKKGDLFRGCGMVANATLRP